MVDVSGSQVYPGATTRKAGVYVPAAYVVGTKAPILIIHDYGSGQLVDKMGQPTSIAYALDNLTIST